MFVGWYFNHVAALTQFFFHGFYQMLMTLVHILFRTVDLHNMLVPWARKCYLPLIELFPYLTDIVPFTASDILVETMIYDHIPLFFHPVSALHFYHHFLQCNHHFKFVLYMVNITFPNDMSVEL